MLHHAKAWLSMTKQPVVLSCVKDLLYLIPKTIIVVLSYTKDLLFWLLTRDASLSLSMTETNRETRDAALSIP